MNSPSSAVIACLKTRGWVEVERERTQTLPFRVYKRGEMKVRVPTTDAPDLQEGLQELAEWLAKEHRRPASLLLAELQGDRRPWSSRVLRLLPSVAGLTTAAALGLSLALSNLPQQGGRIALTSATEGHRAALVLELLRLPVPTAPPDAFAADVDALLVDLNDDDGAADLARLSRVQGAARERGLMLLAAEIEALIRADGSRGPGRMELPPPTFGLLRTVGSFLQHIPIAAIAILVLLLMTGRIGQSLGVHLLVWHERAWPRFAAGLSLTLLVALLALVAFLLDRTALEALAAGRPSDGRFVLERYVLEVLATEGLLAVAFASAAALLAKEGSPSQGAARRPGILLRAMFPAGAALGVALILAILWARGAGHLDTLSAWVGAAFEWLQWVTHARTVPPRELNGLIAVVWCVLGPFVLVAPWFPRVVTPVMSVSTLLGVLTVAYASVAFWVDSPIPIAFCSLNVFVLFLTLGGARRYRVRYAQLGPQRRLDASPDSSDPPLLPIDTPIRRRSPGPLVVVCTSGGASRAAAWTAALLARLESEIPGFGSRIVLVTGASGGMVGAADHIAGMSDTRGLFSPCADPRPASAPVEPAKERPQRRVVGLEDVEATSTPEPWLAAASDAIRRLGDDHLSYVVHRLVHVDVPLAFLPFTRPDRGHALEDAWRDHLDGRLSNTRLSDLRASEEDGWRPSLVFSPMLVEDGRRLLISNLDLATLATNEVRTLVGADDSRPSPNQKPPAHPAERCVESRSEVELLKLFPTTGPALTLATAARMSASFPYVSPAATLPTIPRRRVVDAGYYDNYGVNLAAIWLDANRKTIEELGHRVVVVQIRDGPLEDEHARPDLPVDETCPLTRGLEGLTSPISGILSSRNASMSYRNDEVLESLQRSWPDLATVVFEGPPDVSMTWYLSQAEQLRLVEALRAQTTRIQALEAWFTAPKPHPGSE